MQFADELVGRVRELGHPRCVGLDPHIERIPEPFCKRSVRPEDPENRKKKLRIRQCPIRGIPSSCLD